MIPDTKRLNFEIGRKRWQICKKSAPYQNETDKRWDKANARAPLIETVGWKRVTCEPSEDEDRAGKTDFCYQSRRGRKRL